MREGTPASEPARGWYPSTRIGRRMATRDLCHAGLVAVTVDSMDHTVAGPWRHVAALVNRWVPPPSRSPEPG